MEIIKEGYTRVSQILSQWDRYSGIDQQVLANKVRIGINVHTCIDMYNNCLPYEAAPDEEPYVHSYILWREKEKFEIFASETRLYDDKLMITGKFDGLIKFKGEVELMLCDWKCSYSEDPLNWPLQGSFYHYLLERNDVKNVGERCRFVKLNKNGGLPKVFEYQCTPELNMMCQAATKTYYYQKPWLDKRGQGIRND